MNFNPNAAADPNAGIYGLPFNYDDAQLILVPVPWDVTTSYRPGTSQGPAAILEASRQVDLFDLEVVRPYECGLYMLPLDERVMKWNEEARALAESVLEYGHVPELPAEIQKKLNAVNAYSIKLNEWVYAQTKKVIDQKKSVALVGGDHAVPFGAFKAIAEHYSSFGILHIDAHSDTRKAYEGFQFSHASIMHNALEQVSQISKLVQVGIRDFCEEEIEYCGTQGNRVEIFFDQHLQEKSFLGTPWIKTVDEILSRLPEHVWISFDIDGLNPAFCPNTGTPVPGGLQYNEALFLLKALARSQRKIIGFDLNEVGAEEWDANVGARLLYKISGYTLANQKKASWQ